MSQETLRQTQETLDVSHWTLEKFGVIDQLAGGDEGLLKQIPTNTKQM